MAADLAALAAFAHRLRKFDPAALIRLRNGWAWGYLPWEVLVAVPFAAANGDTVVSALDRQPTQSLWRVPLPPPAFRTVEVLPPSVVPQAAQSAARTLKELAGRAGERAIRDALLDHQVVVGESDVDGTPFVVTQRLVQAMVRMNLSDNESVEVLLAGPATAPWTGLATSRGQSWWRQRSQLTVRTIVNKPYSR